MDENRKADQAKTGHGLTQERVSETPDTVC